MGEHGQGGPAVPGGPAADLVLIQPGEILGGLEGFFDAPALPRDADQGAQRDRAWNLRQPLDPQNMALTRCRWSSGVIDAARRSQTRRSFTIAHNVWSQSGPNRGPKDGRAWRTTASVKSSGCCGRTRCEMGITNCQGPAA